MEQILLDFFVKSCELVLHNRVPHIQIPSSTSFSSTLTQNPFKFQLSFDKKLPFTTLLSSDLDPQIQKLLVIEIFACSKASNEKLLIEQWIFEINPVCDGKIADTIDSSNTLYKRLSILLRTISLLTVTLPTYQKLVREKGSSGLSLSYIIEHDVISSKESMSIWPSSVVEEDDLVDYKSSEFVLPGRTFSFKVNYSKSLKFLQKSFETGNKQIENEEIIQWRQISSVKRAHSDNLYNKDIRALEFVFSSNSPPVAGYLEDNDNMCSSQIEAIPVRERVNSTPCRNDSIPKIWDITKALDSSKLKIKTLESESFCEEDIFVCENDEDKFTEVLSWKDISIRNHSPTRINFQQRNSVGSSGMPLFRKISEDCERNRMRTSINAKPIEKIIEQTNDDKVAELLNSIEELKNLTKKKDNTQSEHEKEEAQKNEVQNKKGLRFENMPAAKRGSEDINPFLELNELKCLYLQIKRSGSAK